MNQAKDKMRKEENIDVLLLNILAGKADEEEIQLFAEWVKETKNALYFDDIKQAWTISESLSFNIPVNQTGKAQYLHKIQSDKKRTRLRRFALISSSAVASLLAVYFFFAQSKDVTQLSNNNGIIAEVKTPSKIDNNSEVVLISSSADGSVLDVTKVSESIIENKTSELKSALAVDSALDKLVVNRLVVPKGKRILVILSDGTKMWVNSDSEVKYPSVFPKDKRALEVVGNVYFEVAKDKTRPFEVTINGLKTTALGTQFEVNNYGGLQCSIALLEGLISIDNGKNKLIVEPNNHVIAQMGSEKLTMSRFDAELYGLWRENILVINNEPIALIIEKLNRWHNIEIENRTLGLENICFTGKLHEATLEDHLRIISDNIKLQFTKEGDKMIVWN